MSLPLNVQYLLIAAVPVIFLLVAVMRFGWGVAKAAPLGMGIAFLLAVTVFRASPLAMLYEMGKGAWNASTILLVIWPAVFSYELSCESKGFRAIANGIQSLTRHELLQILILGWVFPSFLQGITGFGVAVAVGAPLLLSIGVSPLYSIVIVLLCHCWGATFGTLALAWDALIAQAQMTASQNAYAALLAAGMIWIFNLICVVYCCWLYGKGEAIKEGLPIILLLSLVMGGGELLLAPINATVACFLPSTAALAVIILISRTKRYRSEWSAKNSPIMCIRNIVEDSTADMGFHQAFLPYYALTAITVVCLLVPPVKAVLGQWKICFSFPETITGFGFLTSAEASFSPMAPLTYAGTFLLLSVGLSFLYYRKKRFIATSDLVPVWKRTAQKCMPSTIAILSLITMSKFMSSSGMIYVLSRGIVSILGKFYVIVSPFLGMLGAFISSSNMSSNILFGSFQSTAAELLDINPAVTVALQTVGGVLGDAFAPGCLIMGISTTGFSGGDEKILKRIIPICVICAVIFGAFSYLVLV